MIPLSSVPIDVRKEYALALCGMNLLEPWEALAITIEPGDTLVPEEINDGPPRFAARPQPRERHCATCGARCFSKGMLARCWDCYNKTRRTTRGFCSHGHPWTPENVYTRPNGDKYCRVCMNDSKRDHRARYGRRDRAAAA